ncbi:MAG: hypothetical protein J6D28_04595 [Bacilli bacterium]|nr:hypothetical protein [Bacilli bacterium]
MKRVKWENIVFILLVGGYIYNAFSITNNVIQTLIIQIGMSAMLRLGIKYIRVNWEQVKKNMIELVMD